MINGNLEFTKADFMQFRDLETSLEWHIIQLKELKENYKEQERYQNGKAGFCRPKKYKL